MNSNQNTMKERRNLSGVYFKSKNEDSGNFDNVVFEDLSEREQDTYMLNRDKEWLKNMIKILANTLNKIGNEFNLQSD